MLVVRGRIGCEVHDGRDFIGGEFIAHDRGRPLVTKKSGLSLSSITSNPRV